MRVVGAELEPDLRAIVGAGGRDHRRADHVLGDLDADRAEIAAGAHDQHGLAGLELGDVEQQVPGGRHVAHHDGRVVEIEPVGKRDRRAGRHADQLGEAARPLDAHHADRARCSRSPSSAQSSSGIMPAAATRMPGCQLRHARADRVDDAGAIDARDERQRRPARALAAGAQAHVEHAVDGGGMDADADLALARRAGRARPRTSERRADRIHGSRSPSCGSSARE